MRLTAFPVWCRGCLQTTVFDDDDDDDDDDNDDADDL